MPLQNTSVDPLAELSDDDIDKMLGLETSKLTPKLSSVDSRLIKLDYTDEGDEEFFRLLGESSGVKPKSDIGDMVKEVGTESAKAIPRVLGAVAGQIALAPGAGIRSAIELLPQISTDPSGPLFKSGDVSNAARIFEEIMSVPGKLIATEEQAKAVENLGYAAKPFQMAGEGWRLIGEQANEGLKSLGFADTYIEPLLATYGEAAAIFGLPGLVKRINSSNTWRQFSVKERGLVVQSLTDAVKNNPNMTEGELIRKYDSIDKQWFKESAAKRTVGERPTIKTEQKGVPKTEPPKTVPPNSRPSHEFVSKKGNRYVKVGDNWYSSEGKLMTNRFVIGAAERGATVYGETEVTPTEPEVIAPQVEQEPDDSKSIIDKHFGEPTEVLTKAVKDRSEIERTKTTEEIVEPAESPKVAEAKGFTTAKGSTYTVNEDGTTTRNKAARQEHPGEEGIQPKSKKTWYVTWEDTNKLSEVQALGGAKTTINELPDGRIGVKYLSGKDKGEFERRTVVTYKSSPEIGLMPVEYFGDNKTIHFGNKIVKLVRVGEDKFEDAKDRIEEAVTTPLQGGEVKVEPETKPTKQPKTKKLTANSISRFYKSQGYSSKEALDLAKFDLEAGLPDMYARETGTPVTIENYGDMIEHWRTYTEEQALAAEPAEQVGEVETLTVDQSPFRVKDKEVILQQLRNTPDYRKIDDIDILTNKLAMEVNAAIEGISGDIGPARKLIEALSDQLNVWVTGNELPGGIFSELSLAELSHYADVFREMKKWVGQADKREVKEPGIKLFSIGGAIVESVKGLAKMAKGRSLVKLSFKDLRQVETKFEDNIKAWLKDDIDAMPKPKALYRGIPKGVIKKEAGGVSIHGTPWPTIAHRGGKLGGESDVYSYPVSEDTLYYRGGSLAGDPLEETDIPSARGMTWNELMDSAKGLYYKKLTSERAKAKKYGYGVEEEHILNDVISDLRSTSFEVDLSNKPGIWRGKATHSDIDKRRPKLRNYDDLWEAVEEKKSLGYKDEDIPELDILNRSSQEPSEVSLYSLGGATADSVRQIFNKLTFRKTALQPRPPAPFSIKELARESVRERRSKLDIATYETNRFINSIERKTTPEQQEVLTFMLEKTDIPDEFNRPDLQRVLKSDKEKLEPIAREIKEWFDEGWKNIKRHIPDLSVKQIENYVTHLWDIPKHKRAEATAWFSTQNQFLERRFIPTYEEGIKRGYKPKTINVLEIIKVHDSVTNRAIANAEYIDALLKLKADGIHLVQRSTEAPLDFVEVNYPMLTRRIPLSKGQAKKKKEFVKETRVRVHPELVRPLKVIFEQRFDHPILGAYEAINGLMKKSILSLSLFHHGALGETGVALTGIPSTANIYFNPVKIYKALVRDEFDIFTKVDIARDSIVYGVQYGASADYPMARIQRWLDEFANASKGLPIANRITKFMAGFNSTWDKALWSYLHDTLKLYAYESLVAKMDTNLNAEQIIKSKREIAQFVNDTFGGLQWDNLMITPKEVQMMTWVLLSADWTISTTRQALSVTGIGKIHNETAGLRAKLGWKFWIRAGLYFGLGMNVLNALFREWDMRENPQYYEGDKFTLFDKTMWGNSPGQKTYLFAGRYEDGSERYIRWGKQFRDFFELFDNPLGKIGGKAAPIPTLLSEVFTGHTPSGFRIDDIYKQKGLKYALGIAKTASKAFVPLSIRKAMQEDVEWKATDLMMQSTKGMSRYAAIDYFKQSILDEDWQMFEETYFAALRNNLPAFTLVNDALGWISAEEFIELGKTIDDIDDVKAKMSVTGSGIERQRLGKILARLEREKADIQQGSKLLNGALEKAKSHSIIEGKIQYPQLPTAGIRYRRPEL
jgi:hypothetical protein